MYKITQYNSLNVKISNSQLNKLKSAIKNETEVVFKSFTDNSSADIKFSKTQLLKMIQSRRFLRKLLGPLPLIKNVITPLPKSVLILLGLTAADAGIYKKILGSGNTTIIIIWNNEIEDFSKIVKSLEDSGLLIKGITETIQNEVKKQKSGFLSMLLGTLGANY